MHAPYLHHIEGGQEILQQALSVVPGFCAAHLRYSAVLWPPDASRRYHSISTTKQNPVRHIPGMVLSVFGHVSDSGRERALLPTRCSENRQRTDRRMNRYTECQVEYVPRTCTTSKAARRSSSRRSVWSQASALPTCGTVRGGARGPAGSN